MSGTTQESPISMRQRAEEKLSAQKTTADSMGQLPLQGTVSDEETQQLVHELQVHQIELEIQNEELLRTQNDLDSAKSRYFNLYDLAPVAYLTLSNEGLILEANLSGAILFGLTRSEMTNRPITSFIFAEDQDAYFLHRKRVTELNEMGGIDLRIVRADGSIIWVHKCATLAKDGEYLATFTDITAHKKAEEGKRLLEQQLQQAQKAECLGVLAGGIAHDFNNILAIIIGYCSLITLHPEKEISYIPEIQKAAERAAVICRQMLSYAGKSTLIMKKVEMAGLVNETLAMLRSTIKQNVVIRSDLAGTIPAINGDESQLRQIVTNLVINAAEAIGDAEGEVRVRLATTVIVAGKGELDHLGNRITPGWYLCLDVTDSGCGMDEETLHRFFEPFYTTKFTGRGLGMASSTGIISAHAGAVQVSSQLGIGSTFKVYLPLECGGETDNDSAVQPDVLMPWRGSGVILLVEDEKEVSQIAKTMLEELGFTVICAFNGVEALEAYHSHSSEICLVLTDIGMPVMDGYTLLDNLKELNPELPIIISSGYGDAMVTSRIPHMEIAGLISKPYHFKQLSNMLKCVLDKDSSIERQGSHD